MVSKNKVGFLNKLKDSNPEAGSQVYLILSAKCSFGDSSYKRSSIKKNIEGMSNISNIFESQIINGNVHLVMPIKISISPKDSCKLNIKVHSNFYGEFFFLELLLGDNTSLSFWANYSTEKEDMFRKGNFEIYLTQSNNDATSKKLILKEKIDIVYEKSITPNFLVDDFLFFLTYIYMYTHEKKYEHVVNKFVGADYKLYLQMEWVENLNMQLNNFANSILNLQDFTKEELVESKDRIDEVLKKHIIYIQDNDPVYSDIQISHMKIAIEYFDTLLSDSIDNYFDKLFTNEWVENFEIMEWGEPHLFLEKKSDMNFWNIIRDLPAFNNECNICHISPENTNYGLVVSGFDMRFKKKKIDLIPTAGYQDLSRFWKNWFPVSPFTVPEYIKGDEIHVDFSKLDMFLELFETKSSLTNNDLQDLIFSVSKEIEDDQQYVLHPDATFDMQNNIFPTVTINKDSKNNYEYYAKFNTHNKEFFTISFNLLHGSSSIISAIGYDFESSAKNELSLYCIQLLRDFLVPECREIIFSEKKKKGIRIKTLYDDALKVIYIPRIKYKYVDSIKFKTNYENNFPYRPKQKHKVNHHLRQLLDDKNPSIESILLARKYNCSIPEGYTFVRAHERGGFNEDQKKIYRSRSMLLSSYEGKKKKTSEIKWFKFEQDIGKLFESKLKKVIVRSPTNDGGVDVEGIDDQQNTVFIQCKCYSPRRKVDRGIVDELIGVITRFKKKYNTSKVRGILVTTSSFSHDAINAANDGDIEMLSGNQLEKMGLK